MPLIESLVKQNNRLAYFFIKELAMDLGMSDTRTVNLTQKHIRGRLAESLLMLKDNYGMEEDGITLSIYMAREDLANLIEHDYIECHTHPILFCRRKNHCYRWSENSNHR